MERARCTLIGGGNHHGGRRSKGSLQKAKRRDLANPFSCRLLVLALNGKSLWLVAAKRPRQARPRVGPRGRALDQQEEQGTASVAHASCLVQTEVEGGARLEVQLQLLRTCNSGHTHTRRTHTHTHTRTRARTRTRTRHTRTRTHTHAHARHAHVHAHAHTAHAHTHTAHARTRTHAAVSVRVRVW
jgi:hypothetical protein